MNYDVIIAGASFAGLAVAAQLPGKRVLLLDPKPIGAGQTSACGTLVSTLRELGLQDSIQQIHHQVALHTPGRTFIYPVEKDPFCTFDYSLLCRLLYARSNVEFIHSHRLALYRQSVRTPRGVFRGDIVVDASGWRASLAKGEKSGLIRRDRLNFGVETTVSYQDDGLHFWYNPAELLPKGITWAFPAGNSTRVGIASYVGETRLKDGLNRFMDGMDFQGDGLHGGYFPHALRTPLVNGVFLVGDAAGHCLGLTGEGIRPALFFGTHLGHLLGQVLDGEINLETAQQAYKTLFKERRSGYKLLCRAQRALPRLPLPLLQMVMALVARPTVLNPILAVYWRAFRLDVAHQAVPASLAAVT